MNTPRLICNQIPCRDIPYLRSNRLRLVQKMAYVYWGLAETPPLFEDDTFTELAKWQELFLLAYDENAEAILREKVRFAQK